MPPRVVSVLESLSQHIHDGFEAPGFLILLQLPISAASPLENGPNAFDFLPGPKFVQDR